MSSIFLTPASIGYLTQVILSIPISVYLLFRARQKSKQSILLAIFFCLITIFLALLFFDAVLLPYPRLLVVYAENTILALALVFLIQFAYHFPQYYPNHKWISRADLMISIGYTLCEMGYMLDRYYQLFVNGIVKYRPPFFDYLTGIVILLVPIAFLQQCIASDSRQVSWIKKLAKPQGKNAKGAQNLFLNFSIIFGLGVINALSGLNIITTTLYNISLSIGILFVLWLLASNYINFIPGGVSVKTKVVILPLTLFLAIMGSVSWAISPSYIETFQPNLNDHQTRRFTPNDQGDYDISTVDFNFENDPGEKVPVGIWDENRNHEVDFNFSLYGKQYSKLYVTNSGIIAMGEIFWQPNMQSNQNHYPAIIPLLVDLDSRLDGGVYIHKDIELNRLIITWYQMPALNRPNSVYTFQAVLYANGIFDITYNGLPEPIAFNADETPSANPWISGVTPGNGENLHVLSPTSSKPCEQENNFTINNYQMDFRQYLHHFMLPLLWVVIIGSLMMLLILPRLLNNAIIQPLNYLLEGIDKIEKENLNISIPMQSEDEIGLLTQHFNKMSARLYDLISDLEERVDVRTMELSNVNKDLRKRLEEINRLQAELKEQSIRDPLTNAYNRRYMMEMLEKELSRAKRENKPLSLIMIDIDHFKNINDKFGHQAGDQILKRLVALITALIRKEDIICRYGGEEFMVILPNASVSDAKNRAEDFRLACEKMIISFNNQPMLFTISLGVVGSNQSSIDSNELMKKADEALYLAKASGRNCVSIYNEPL